MQLLDLDRVDTALDKAAPLPLEGRVTRISGLLVEAVLPRAAIGAGVVIEGNNGPVPAEVVGFSGTRVLLMPVGEVQGLRESATVRLVPNSNTIPVGNALLGRVVDPMMRPMDGRPAPVSSTRASLTAAAPAPMQRRRISRPVVTGVRAIDVCLTLGEGQRMGIMAGAGVGKSVLLGMLARSADADVIVAGLVANSSSATLDQPDSRVPSLSSPPVTSLPCCVCEQRWRPQPSPSTSAVKESGCCSCWTR